MSARRMFDGKNCEDQLKVSFLSFETLPSFYPISPPTQALYQ